MRRGIGSKEAEPIGLLRPEGDRNTRFFHNKAVRRKEEPEIKGIKDNIGSWQKDIKIVESIFSFLEYFLYF